MSVISYLKKLFGQEPQEQGREKIIFESIQKQLQGDGVTFAGQLLQRAYQKFPQNTTLICRGKTVTYEELYVRAVNLSKKLIDRGVGKHDHVLLYYENSLEFYIAYFAIWQCGAVVIPLNIFLHEKELAYIIKDAEPKLIVTTDVFKPKIKSLVTQKLLEALPAILTDDILDEQDLRLDKAFCCQTLSQDDLCVLLYTSGTTGAPKGVMLSSRNILTNTMQGYARFKLLGLKSQERFFGVLPLFHVFAQNTCVWLPVMTGGSVVVVPKIDRKLIFEGLTYKPTIFLGFPALYGLLCLMKTAPLDSVKMFVSGADMLPDKIRSAFAMIYGRKICSGYGLTEAAPVVAVNYHNHEQTTNVVGHLVTGLECQIRDADNKILPDGQIGTLWMRGDNIMLGYYHAPEATQAVLQDGWLNTGDLAVIKNNGMLAITGRSKDLIIHKGFNIYPQEIENVLMLHPAVFKAAVIGRHEVASGQIPVAYVAVKESSGNKRDVEKNLRVLCSNNLAAYKVPRKFVCVDDLPMSATGKVDKKQLGVKS